MSFDYVCSVWRMFSSPVLILLDSHHQQLNSLMQSIINSTREFSEVLIQRSHIPDENTEYYIDFNKWLLGILYYVLKLEELEEIHDVSVKAQLKLLKILYTNRASFLDEITLEYLNNLKELVQFYNSDCDGKSLTIRKFVVDEKKQKMKELNLMSINIIVDNDDMCKNLIRHTVNILGETVAFSNMMQLQTKNDYFEILSDIMGNYSIDLKCTVISILSKIFFYHGIIRSPCIARLLHYIEEICQNEVLWQNMDSNDLNNLATEIYEFNKILTSKDLNRISLELNWNTTFNPIAKPLKVENIVSLRKQVIYSLNSINNVNNLDIYEDASIFDVPISHFLLKLVTESMNVLKPDADDLWKHLMENCSSYSKLCKDIEAMKITAEQSNLPENLNKLNCLLTVTVFYKMEIIKQIHKSFFEINVSNELVLTGCISNFNNLFIFNTGIFSDVVKNMDTLFSSNSTLSFEVCEQIFLIYAKIVFVAPELTLKDLDMILKMQSSLLQQKKQFSDSTDRFKQFYANILTAITYENIFVKKNVHIEQLKKWSLNIIESCAMNKNQVIKLGPALIMNNIFTTERFFCEILSQILHSKHPEQQKELGFILPTLICLTYGHCILIQLPSNIQIDFGYHLKLSDLFTLHIICINCLKTESSSDFESKSRVLIDSAVVLKEKTNVESSSKHVTMLEKFLDFSQYPEDMAEEMGNVLITSARHSIIKMSSLKYFYGHFPLNVTCKFIKNLNEAIFKSCIFNDLQKREAMNLVIDLLLISTKSCLEKNNLLEQEICIEAIRQFALVNYPAVLLPCVKFLIHFTVHPLCPFASKVCIIINEVCEAHRTTPNKVYHLYKKDFCRCMMELTAFNYLNGHGFTKSIFKTVIAFGLGGYREFIMKDSHHALPYLIPFVIRAPKLRSIIDDIASLIHCNSGELLSEGFPNIYTHIYLSMEEKQANMCFKLIENITEESIAALIRKHFRIILTELLLQYCCGSEKVIKACKYLACLENNQHIDLSMSHNQIADFIQPRFLGVLAYFDSKIINPNVALSIKRKALQSFPDVLNLMGPSRMTSLKLKLLASLRTALHLMEDFPVFNANAWNAFVRNVDVIALGSILTSIFVSLMPLYTLAPEEVGSIFEYIIISNENILSSHIPDLFFLQDTNLSLNLKTIIMKHVNRSQPQNVIDKLRWFLKYFNSDMIEIRVDLLKIITNFIKSNQSKIYEMFLDSDDVQSTVTKLASVLVVGCRDSNPDVSDWSGRCLGELGAFEPSLLPSNISRQSSSINPFAFSIQDVTFAKAALGELTHAFQCEKYTKSMDCFALAIQEILKIYNISPNGREDVWNSFSDQMHQVMTPLLTSRYTLAFSNNPEKVHPVYGSHLATSFSEWAFNWASQLISTINTNSIQEIFRMVRPSLKRDSSTLVLFLPYVVLHSILSGNEQSIFEEFLAVISSQSFASDESIHNDKSKYKILRYKNYLPIRNSINIEEGDHLKCSKMVFELLDFLSRWILECINSKASGMKNPDCVKLKNFLSKFDKLAVSQSNFLCGELERSLQYLEFYMEESPTVVQKHLGFLAEIYAALNEPDAVSGILAMKQTEPSLSELILAHNVTGQLQDAAICYEEYAQQGSVDDQMLHDMVEVYLGLDQPYTALKLLQGSKKEYFGGPIAAEPLWRLGMYGELDNLLEENYISNDDGWGVIVGRSLLDLRKSHRASFQSNLLNARKSMLRKLSKVTGGTVEETRIYTQAYDSILGLHMISEIEHMEEILHKIKSLRDGDVGCAMTLNKLIDQWNGKLKLLPTSPRTVEPILRLRRILLEQSKHVLDSSHPQTVSLFDAHIGKIWLQSSKFARKAGIFQQAYIYILSGEKYQPKELFIEKAKLYWMRGQQEPAFHTLKRGLEEHFSDSSQLSLFDRKLCAKAKLLIAIYNDETTNVDMDVNIDHYKKAVEMYREREKSLVYLAAYYERIYAALNQDEKNGQTGETVKIKALDCYGRALQYGHSRLYQSMPRMLSIWLDFEINPTDSRRNMALQNLKQICSMIEEFSNRLPNYLFLTAFSQIISRICHPIKEVYNQLKKIIIKLMLAYPQHTLWMMMCVIKSSYPQRVSRWNDIMKDPRLQEPGVDKLIKDFKQLAEKLIELCNKPIAKSVRVTHISTQMRSLPRLLASENFSQIIIPHEKFIKVTLPHDAINKDREPYNPFPSFVHIVGVEDEITIFPTLQKPRKITLRGSDGKGYVILLKPKDDLRKDFRLMEFNAVVNRYLQECSDARARRLYIRTFTVLPLNEECGLIEWVHNLLGFRKILLQLYSQRGLNLSGSFLKQFIVSSDAEFAEKKKMYLDELLPRHPPLFGEWFRYTFPDPHAWYQARSAYIRTTAVMSMVGYILGLGDRHGENILMDSRTGDLVHVDFNCLFNKGESLQYPERVPFRLTHNMEIAMGPLGYEGMFRKCCEITLKVLRSQTATLMSVIQPFVYDPLVAWQKMSNRLDESCSERTNNLAREHLLHIEQRLQGMVRSKGKQTSLSLSPEGQANYLIIEATSVNNLCQMFFGWGPFY